MQREFQRLFQRMTQPARASRLQFAEVEPNGLLKESLVELQLGVATG
jgi:hypothetical protein